MADHSNNPRASFSIPSILSVLAAIGSFTSGAFFGMVLAAVAVIFGIIGVLLSLAPAKRGGVISTFGVVAGALGVIAAVIKAVLWIFS